MFVLSVTNKGSTIPRRLDLSQLLSSYTTASIAYGSQPTAERAAACRDLANLIEAWYGRQQNIQWDAIRAWQELSALWSQRVNRHKAS